MKLFVIMYEFDINKLEKENFLQYPGIKLISKNKV